VDAEATAGRRDRQLIELLLLFAQGDRRRAAVLATEHAMEFPADAGALADVSAWIDGPASPSG
jgi:hypothetical protein